MFYSLNFPTSIFVVVDMSVDFCLVVEEFYLYKEDTKVVT